MRESSRYIIQAGAFISYLSCVYFLSLLLPVPFPLTVLIVAAPIYLFYRWSKQMAAPAGNDNGKKYWLSLLLLIIGLSVIYVTIFADAPKYGGYDARGLWVLDAKYLVDPVNWKKLFQNVAYSHPDYPLCMSSAIAFFMRLLSTDETVMVPFIFCASLTFAIPVLIYQEVQGKSLLIAVIALTIFAAERYYSDHGVSQYADILLAFFFLCAFICANHMGTDKKYVGLCAFFLASCAWTKNEGSILAIIFACFYARGLFSKGSIKYASIGASLPLLTLLVFKMICGAQNDIVGESGTGTFGLLAEPARYAAIWKGYWVEITAHYTFTTIAIAAYIIASVMLKIRPRKQLYVLLACLFAYSMVYVVTPKDLAWHLATSQSRLMLQLMPALIYVMANQMADAQFSKQRWPKQKASAK